MARNARRSARRTPPRKTPPKGNKETRPRARTRQLARPSAWIQEHARAALGSLGRMWRNPVANGMTAAVIAIALALPASLWMLLQNVERATAGWDAGARISVYLEPGLESAAVDRATETIAGRESVRILERISPDEALAEFRSLAGFEDALSALDGNPLPAVVVIEPTGNTPRSASALEGLARTLDDIAGVDRVQVDLEWVERLYALLDLIERGVGLFAVLLAAGVLLIVGNTIRLDILNRRQEIHKTDRGQRRLHPPSLPVWRPMVRPVGRSRGVAAARAHRYAARRTDGPSRIGLWQRLPPERAGRGGEPGAAGRWCGTGAAPGSPLAAICGPSSPGNAD